MGHLPSHICVWLTANWAASKVCELLHLCEIGDYLGRFIDRCRWRKPHSEAVMAVLKGCEYYLALLGS